jgi:hypothetical protein
MQQMIKKFLWVGLLTFGLPSAYAFSLLGPTGNGGDAWQVPAIGWGNNIDIGDVGSAKNLGEEYRRNTPVIYYTYDANFLDYFGSNGVVAVDNATAIMNALSNVDAYNYSDMSAVSQFPFDTRETNFTAGAEELMDLKSAALFTIVEQMGLANPVRYTWALHDRTVESGPAFTNPCPAGIIYTIVQRNFDPITWRPTNVVNNVLYGYTILETCGMGAVPADAIENEFDEGGSAVAGGLGWEPGLSFLDGAIGIFYTGLTWDDVGGLRYLYTSNNIIMESPPSGTLASSTNFNAEIQITTSSLIALTLASLTNDPTALQTLFPNLVISSVTTNSDGTFSYTFANVVTNSFSTNATVQILTTNVAPVIGAPVGSPAVTNVTTSKAFSTNIVTGDFFIFPSNSCGFNIVQTISNLTTTTTNLLVVGTNSAGNFFSESLISHSTNHVLLVAPCTFSTSGTELYEGVEKIQFVRADFDSLLGQFFEPITNNYSMVEVTNSQAVSQSLQRIVTQPDILFSAADLAPGPAAGQGTELNPFLSRNINFDQNNIGAGLAGPGTITSPSTISFNKVGNIFINGGSEDTNAIYGTNSQSILEYVWGSFNDVSPSNIVVYPNGTDIQNLENQALVQITPASPLPNGTSGTAYPSTTFTTTGGAFTPPFTWSAPGGMPPGLNLSAGGTVAGTPTQAGTFDFVIQMTDVNTRSVQWIYSITIN